MQLPKIHWIYILALLSIVYFIPLIRNKINQSEEYFGIAENQVRSYAKSTEIKIKHIHVKLGQEVKIGDTLMTFYPENLLFKKQDLESQSKILSINRQIDKYELQITLDRLISLRQSLSAEHDLKINKLKDQKRLTDSLTKLVLNQPISDSKYQMELNNLLSARDLDLKQHDLKIEDLKKQLQTTPDATPEKQLSITNEIKKVIELQGDLTIIADMDGVVGELNYKTGDAINAFQSILKLYSIHPTLVTSYINEQYIGKVAIQDSVYIYSITNPNYSLHGKILNLGSRITALPERLKKIPELKAWGREIQIEIPIDNNFIQGEKVKVVFSTSLTK